MIPFVFLTLLPILGYGYMTSTILRASLVKNVITIMGMAFAMIVSLFLIVSLGLFKFSLKSALCKDIENGFLGIYNSTNGNQDSIDKTITICGDEFDFIKGSYEIRKSANKLVKLEWGVKTDWYLILIPIALSFIILVLMIALLIHNKYIKDSNNSLYTIVPEDGNLNEKRGGTEEEKDFAEELDSFWGRDDWYDYTDNKYPFALILASQVVFISSIVLISIFKFSNYLMPFFILLFAMLGSYYFLLFYGIRDNYLIKIMKQEGDIVQFLDKLKKKKPMVAAYSTVFINNKVVKSLEPKKLVEWHDASDLIDINSKRPIIEIEINEEYEFIKKRDNSNNIKNNNSSSLDNNQPPPPVQVKNKLDNFIFIKSDLPNYYIYSSNSNRIPINRTLHGILVILGLSFIYKVFYLNQLIEKKSYTSKTKFR